MSWCRSRRRPPSALPKRYERTCRWCQSAATGGAGTGLRPPHCRAAGDRPHRIHTPYPRISSASLSSRTGRDAQCRAMSSSSLARLRPERWRRIRSNRSCKALATACVLVSPVSFARACARSSALRFRMFNAIFSLRTGRKLHCSFANEARIRAANPRSPPDGRTTIQFRSGPMRGMPMRVGNRMCFRPRPSGGARGNRTLSGGLA